MVPQRNQLRNQEEEGRLFARRAFITLLGVFVLLLVLFSNVYGLQVNEFKKYQTRSNDNRIKVLPVTPNRGLIYDRNGVLLAENRPVYSLEVIPEEVEELDQTITGLNEFLALSDDEIEDFKESLKRTRRFKPVELKSNLSEEQVAQFTVNQHKFPGVHIEARLKRYYPFSDLTTHSVGYVAKINRQDLVFLEEQNLTETYAATRDIGKLGLEKFYQNELHGSPGHHHVEVDSRGRIVRTLDFTPPTPGSDIHLTLDIELQMIAKKALSGKRGAVVAIDPRDGSLLAMYSSPSYDPNLFVHGISSKEYKKLLSSERPLLNRTTQGLYPPASTIKPFIGLMGLEHEAITPDTKIWDPGFFKLKNVSRKYRDHKKWGHGWVDLNTALEVSCNTYFYHLAHKLGIDTLSPFFEKLGFGEKTGIDILEEYDAVLPSRHWKRIRHNQPWYQGDTVNIGIGQGYWIVTPLQLAQATSILVSKGQITTPHLLKAIAEPVANENVNENNSDLFSYNQIPFIPETAPPIELSKPESWDIILESMYNTVQNKTGTGFKAFKGATYQAAGKSGTAEIVGLKQDVKYDATKIKEQLRDNAMFIAYAPYDAPEIVVAVAIENVAKGGGGSNAGPVARQIMDQYFANRDLAMHAKTSKPAVTKG